jgi:acetoin utilization deacetylase AcuC-like enzyme
MKVGVFFHPLFSQKSWPVMGDKFRNFPQVMQETLKLSGVKLFEPRPVSEKLLLKVHTKGLVDQTKKAWYWEGASLSVGGCVEAAEKIWEGEINMALVFDVAAGHHAGPSSAWGGTYLSCLGPTITNLKERLGIARFAILDTDCHHGDGTRAIFKGDREILHVCFCSQDDIEDEGTKIDVGVNFGITDEEYLQMVKDHFISRALEFTPKMIFHNLGHDTAIGDYGDRGLTNSFFVELAKMVKECAANICDGKYMIITHGGARADVADYIFPRIIQVLAASEG